MQRMFIAGGRVEERRGRRRFDRDEPRFSASRHSAWGLSLDGCLFLYACQSPPSPRLWRTAFANSPACQPKPWRRLVEAGGIEPPSE